MLLQQWLRCGVFHGHIQATHARLLCIHAAARVAVMPSGGGSKAKKKAEHGGPKLGDEPEPKQRKMEGLCRCSLCTRTSKDRRLPLALRH